MQNVDGVENLHKLQVGALQVSDEDGCTRLQTGQCGGAGRSMMDGALRKSAYK